MLLVARIETIDSLWVGGLCPNRAPRLFAGGGVIFQDPNWGLSLDL